MAAPLPAPTPRADSARAPRRVFVASAAAAVLCVPAAAVVGEDTAWLLQMALVALTFCAAGVTRHRTRVYGDGPGERAPIVLGPPRRPGRDAAARLRLTAGCAMGACALYYLAMVALLVAPTVRGML